MKAEHYGYLSNVPKTMPKREMELLVKLLSRIKNDATMERANFSDELKETTRIWRNSWIVNPLSDIIKRYEEELSKR